MHEQRSEHRTDPGGPEAEGRRRASVAAFVAGVVAGLGFLLFFPGLPHVIDRGALPVAPALGVVARAGCLAWPDRRGADRSRR
nr:hypothetical protein [Streptomyces abyssomicinicus]